MCSSGGSTNYENYFNNDGGTSNPQCNYAPPTGTPKCFVGDENSGEQYEDTTKRTQEQCASMCSTAAPYVYWTSNPSMQSKSLCPINDKEQCWSQSPGINANSSLEILRPLSQNVIQNPAWPTRCAGACNTVDDRGSITDDTMNIQYNRRGGLRFWSKRGLLDPQTETCLNPNVKRCWWENVKKTGVSGQANLYYRDASLGTLEDQKFCAQKCNSPSVFGNIKWGTTRANGVDICSNPNRMTSPL
jgi:hypothetical protein